ncbi:bifunctional folylpolyglutamate synthase/dihydrofolate synthase [Chloroflexota bacterium]
MDYQAALDYILSFADFERVSRSALVFDLRRVEMLLERQGNPHTAAKTVHIAGTKGKGSTAAMVASILTRAGYKTGLYTSPHLFSFVERMQVDGKSIAGDTFARLTEALQPDIEIVNREGTFGELTTFELLTVLAFAYFREMGVAYQVVETGLGGRLDATNVVTPEVCVITSISIDHTDVLGDTLARIAAEKAGIIKPGSTVVCSPQFPEAMEVIERVCRERGARLVRVNKENWQGKASSSEGQSFELKGIMRQYALTVPLLGEHQLENAAVAVTTVEVLSESGANVPVESITSGLAQVHWPGRLQILRRKPWFIVDGAHNAYSARRLGEALRRYFDFDRLLLIFGASSDKRVSGMAAELAPLAGDIIVTQSRNPRAVDSALLFSEFSEQGIIPEVTGNIASAVDLALGRAKPGDLICATGSIFVIAEVMEYLAEPGK